MGADNSSKARIPDVGNRSPGNLPLDRLSRLALILAWVVLGGALLLEAADQVRFYLGYEAFDSQRGAMSLVSLLGLVLVYLAAIFQFLLAGVGLAIALSLNDQVPAKRLGVGLLINFIGFAVLAFL
ncbi:MAG: hypothetical protein R3F50_22110 [Gammaproteobacteria bacterium]|jgi:hypothetical protein